jgi:hypothetical protein
MEIKVIGLDHDTQWRDKTGHLKALLMELLKTEKPEFIAEEAFTLPTTIAARLCMKVDIPWIDVDMNHYQRKVADIDEQVPCWPIFNDHGFVGSGMFYDKRVQDIRENYWISQVEKQRCEKAWLICGSIHLAPIANKLRERGHVVAELKIWEFDWYLEFVGKFKIIEDGEKLTSEFLRS